MDNSQTNNGIVWKDYSIEEFIAQDNPEPLKTTRNISMENFTPLGEPIWIKVK